MRSLRNLIGDHRCLAIVVIALALCMKIMVPSGFMVGAGPKSLSIMICDGRGLELMKQISLPQAGWQAGPAPEQPAQHGKASDACPYAALGMTGLSGAPAALLVVALAFMRMAGIRPAPRPQPARRSFLRPPLRAPPVRG